MVVKIKKKLLCLTFAGLMLSGCQSAPLMIDSSCLAFAPIYASRQDTTETKRQILNHNQSWQARCGGKK